MDVGFRTDSTDIAVSAFLLARSLPCGPRTADHARGRWHSLAEGPGRACGASVLMVALFLPRQAWGNEAHQADGSPAIKP